MNARSYRYPVRALRAGYALGAAGALGATALLTFAQPAPATPAVDVLVYLVSGRMQITIGDEVKTVSAGDALREEAGKPASWDVLEDSVFVATNAPLRRAPQEKTP